MLVDDKKIEAIAKVCHQANKAWCEANGQTDQRDWEYSPRWQKDSAIAGVTFCIENPDAPASANHEAWSRQKIADGWVYGEVKDEFKKTHNCLVPFEQLPLFQRQKDILFKSIVASLTVV